MRTLALLAMALPACASTDLQAAADVTSLLDAWHRAAAAADETAYFGAMAPDFVFLGTDMSERWDVASFRQYAHPHFAKGKAWSFRATRRAVVVRGDMAWFDEDLATEKLGGARGSGVLARAGGAWRLVQYVLSLTIPNERFDAVRKALGE